MNKTIIPHILSALAAFMPLTACNGIFSDIYDDADAEIINEYGFITPSSTGQPGKIYVDATSYTDWVYLNFGSMTATTLDVSAAAPEQWDIALHRYDAKTNGGAAAETGATGFSSFYDLVNPAESAFKSDIFTTDRIVTDMSTMMDGYLGYVDSDYNEELSKWLDVDKSVMPPIYTLSNKVYVVKLKNGTRLALKLENFMDAVGVKGFLTISYIYPFNPAK